MEVHISSKEIGIYELISPSKEEVLKFVKKFKIKERDIKEALSRGYYAEISFQRNYLVFYLIYPIFLRENVNFERIGLFLLNENKNVLIVRGESREIQRLKTKALFLFKKTKMKNNDVFVTLFIYSLIRSYFLILNKFSHELFRIETSLRTLPPLRTINQIAQVRRNLVFSHTAVKSVLNVISQVVKSNLPLIKNNPDYWETIQDNTAFILEKLDDYEKILEGLSRSFESRLSLEINEAVRVLTLIQSIFMPAMLISSIYGMNVSLPFGEAKYAFFILLILMSVTTFLFIKFIKKIIR